MTIQHESSLACGATASVRQQSGPGVLSTMYSARQVQPAVGVSASAGSAQLTPLKRRCTSEHQRPSLDDTRAANSELAQAMEDSVGASRNPSMQRRTQSGMLDREMLALAKTSQRAAREESVDVLP